MAAVDQTLGASVETPLDGLKRQVGDGDGIRFGDHKQDRRW